MIFLLAEPEILFVFLMPDDLVTLKSGRTLFVDDRQIGNHKFNRVILAFVNSKEDVHEMLRKAGKDPGDMVNPQAKPEEDRCLGCNGLVLKASLLGGKCIVCWKELAEGKS